MRFDDFKFKQEQNVLKNALSVQEAQQHAKSLAMQLIILPMSKAMEGKVDQNIKIARCMR